MKHLKDIPYRKWSEIFEGLGLKKYAASQVYQWLFKKGATSFDEMTNLSNDARRILSENYYIGRPKIVDTLVDPDDGTKKFLFELEDGERIEAVMIPVGKTGDCVADARNDIRESLSHCEEAKTTKQSPGQSRITLCISSQVGCALGCLFCRTAGIGFIRNLTTSEIVDQVLEVKRYLAGDSRLRGNDDRGEALDCFPPKADPPRADADARNDGQSGTKDASHCEEGEDRRSNLEGSNVSTGLPRSARNDGVQITNIVFMGMGEPAE